MQSNLQSNIKFILSEKFPRLEFSAGRFFPQKQQTKLVHRGDFEFEMLLIIQGREIRK